MKKKSKRQLTKANSNNLKDLKIKSFEDALRFYHKTRKDLGRKINEAEILSEELGKDQSVLDKEGAPSALTIDLESKNNIPSSQLETWLGTSLEYYNTEIKELLPLVDNQVELFPKLLQGLAKEAKNSSKSLSTLLHRVKTGLSTNGSPSNSQNNTESPRRNKKPIKPITEKELTNIEKSIEKRIHTIKFFKEEVDERFEGFRDSLIDYISTYCVLNHLLECSLLLTSTPKKDVNKVIKKITQFKEPF